MNKTGMWATLAVIIIIVLTIIYWFLNQNNQNQIPTQTQTSDTIKINPAGNLAPYLTDANGMALYIYTKDTVQKSNCNAQCQQLWPPFYAQSVAVSGSLNQSDFSEITAPDTGLKQTTYKGMPLYYYIKDKNAGDATGQGMENVWYVAKP